MSRGDCSLTITCPWICACIVDMLLAVCDALFEQVTFVECGVESSYRTRP